MDNQEKLRKDFYEAIKTNSSNDFLSGRERAFAWFTSKLAEKQVKLQPKSDAVEFINWIHNERYSLNGNGTLCKSFDNEIYIIPELYELFLKEKTK